MLNIPLLLRLCPAPAGLLPGYYAAEMNTTTNTVLRVAICPQGYYWWVDKLHCCQSSLCACEQVIFDRLVDSINLFNRTDTARSARFQACLQHVCNLGTPVLTVACCCGGVPCACFLLLQQPRWSTQRHLRAHTLGQAPAAGAWLSDHQVPLRRLDPGARSHKHRAVP